MDQSIPCGFFFIKKKHAKKTLRGTPPKPAISKSLSSTLDHIYFHILSHIGIKEILPPKQLYNGTTSLGKLDRIQPRHTFVPFVNNSALFKVPC